MRNLPLWQRIAILVAALFAVLIIIVAVIPTEETEPPAAGTVDITVKVSDWTEARSAPDFELWAVGIGSWYPDLTYGSDATTLTGLPVGGDFEVFFYPDGRDGTEVGIVLQATEGMAPNDRDALMVEVYDGTLVVTAAALVGGVSQEFGR